MKASQRVWTIFSLFASGTSSHHHERARNMHWMDEIQSTSAQIDIETKGFLTFWSWGSFYLMVSVLALYFDFCATHSHRYRLILFACYICRRTVDQRLTCLFQVMRRRVPICLRYAISTSAFSNNPRDHSEAKESSRHDAPSATT